jgi:hypothetical protein
MQKPEQAPKPTDGPAPTPISSFAAAVPVGMQGGDPTNPDPLGVNKYIGADGTGKTPLGGVPQKVMNNPFGRDPITVVGPNR